MSVDISRRGFLKGAGLFAGAAAVGGLAACSPSEETAQAADAESTEAAAETAASANAQSTRPEKGQGKYPAQIDTYGPDAMPIDPVDVPASWNAEYDVVVVGSGMGGLTAAVYCAEQGASVACIEKEAETGGAGRHACYNQINAGGGTEQAEVGWYWPQELKDGTKLDGFDAKQATAAFQEHYQYSLENDLLVRAIGEGGKWADWMQGQDGVHWVTFGGGFCYVDEAMANGEHNDVCSNARTIDALVANLEANGGTMMINCPVEGLVFNGEQVLGVKVNDCTGDGEMFVKANQGVILCAGGFGYNLDMLEKYTPSAYMYGVQGGPITCHTGEVTRMAVGLGADISGYNSFCCWDGGLDDYWGEGDGNFWHYLFSPSKDIACYPWPAFDVTGKRIPFYAGQNNFDASPFTGGHEAMTSTYQAGPSHRSYLVLDKDWQDKMATMRDIVFGGSNRLFPSEFYPNTGEEGEQYLSFPKDDWYQDIQNAIDRGAIKQADTIAELGVAMGMEEGVLEAAVARWNELCEAGEDTDLAIPYNPDWLMPISDEGPYLGLVKGGQIAKTFAGLRINDKMQVMNTDHKVIPGLYAGWTTAGGVCGENMINGMWGKASPFGCVAASGVGGWLCGHSVMGEYDA